MIRHLKTIVFLSFMLAAAAGTANAAPALIPVSSATYNGSVGAYGVAVDGAGNIIVAGYNTGSNCDYLVVKYDPNLIVIASATYGAPGTNLDQVSGVAVDGAGNVIMTGNYINDSSRRFDYLTVKLDPNLVFIASATHSGPGSANDWANGVAVDGAGNIIVTGYINNGTNGDDYCTIKYDPNLGVIGSATYNSSEWYNDQAYGVAVDKNGNIIVTGASCGASGFDYCTIKYGPNMVFIASATYDDPSNYNEYARSVAVDGAGNIIVTGYCDGAAGSSYYCTVKYDPNLVFLASATYDRHVYDNDFAYGTSVDGAGNVVVTGYGNNGPSNYDYFTIKYDPNLVVLGTATYNGPANREDRARGAAVDKDGNIYVVGSSNNGSQDECFTIKYSGPPVVTGCAPVFGALGATLDVAITGTNLQPGAAVSFGSGITVNSVMRESASRLTANITIAGDAPLGTRTVTVTNTDAVSCTKNGVFNVCPCAASAVVNPSVEMNLTISSEPGDIAVLVPAGTFSGAVTLAVSTMTVSVSRDSTVKTTNIGLSITNSGGFQPAREITITVYYRDSDIAGFDESKLTLARYENGRWIPLPTVVYAGENKLVGAVRHLSTFAVVQLAPAGDLANVTAYPNPFDPGNGGMTIANLTGEAEIRIFNVSGELVRTLAYTSANGRATWDGRNDGGSRVASGVYLARIQSPQGKKTIKIAVQR